VNEAKIFNAKNTAPVLWSKEEQMIQYFQQYWLFFLFWRCCKL